jgi:hypothetical protein
MLNQRRNRLALAISAAMFIICLAAGVWFAVWYAMDFHSAAVQLPARDLSTAQTTDQRMTFLNNGGVPLKPNGRGQPTPTTLPQLVQHDFADFSLSGQDFEIAPLKNGEKNFINRTYVWENIPPRFANWQVTRVKAGLTLRIIVTANRPVTIYGAAFNPRRNLDLSGWSAVPGVTFNYSNRNHAALIVYERQLQTGQTITAPKANGGAMFILIPN